jgi:hypothetical protein
MVKQARTERLVEQYRERFMAGNNPGVLLDAIDLCARAALPMPLWLAEAFTERYARWASYEAETLDVAFDVERPKGKHLGTQAERERLRHAVVFEVERRHRDGANIDTSLFEAIGREFGIGGHTKVSEIYYEAESYGLRKLVATIPVIINSAKS